MPLEPPPEDQYSSRDELLTAVKGWAATQGNAITIARSDSKKSVVYLKCDKGGKYRNKRQLIDEQKQHRTGSRLSNCPFSVVGSCIRGIWYLCIGNHHLNHDASNSRAAHPSLRRLNKEQKMWRSYPELVLHQEQLQQLLKGIIPIFLSPSEMYTTHDCKFAPKTFKGGLQFRHS